MASLNDIGDQLKNFFSGEVKNVSNGIQGFLQKYPTPASYISPQIGQTLSNAIRGPVSPIQTNPIQNPVQGLRDIGSQVTQDIFNQIPNIGTSMLRVSPPGQLYEYAKPLITKQNIQSYQPQLQKQQQGDLYNSLQGIGLLTSPVQAAIGGGIGSGMGVINNKLNGKPLSQDFAQNFSTSMMQAAPFAPVSAINPIGKGILDGKYVGSPSQYTIPVRAATKGIQQGIEGAFLGAIEPGVTKDRLSKIKDYALFGAITGVLNQAGGDLTNVSIDRLSQAFGKSKDEIVAYLKHANLPVATTRVDPRTGKREVKPAWQLFQSTINTPSDQTLAQLNIDNPQVGNKINQNEIAPSTEKTTRQKLSGLYDQALVKSRNILNSMGDAGKQLASKIDNYYNNSERMVGGASADYQQVVKNLSPQSLENVLRSLDGQQIQLNPAETQAAAQLRSVLNQFASGAQQANLLIRRPDGSTVPFQPLGNYLPHSIDINKLAENKDLAIKSLVDSGQLPNIDVATNIVNDLIKGTPLSEAYRRFMPNIPHLMGNLEYSRILDFPSEVLRYDKKLLPDYFVGSARRIHQAINFGPNNEAIQPLLDKLHTAGYDAQTADQIVKQNLGMIEGNKALQQGLGALKGLQATTKLGLSAISNAGQTVNTATKYGITKTIQGMADALTPKGKDFALRTGAIVEDFLREIERDSTGSTPILEKITAPGFKMVERFNRTVAANVGKRVAESMGITDPAEIQKFAQEAVNTTQFKTRPIDLPPLWQDPVAKVLLQFKNFSYQHTDFILHEVLAPAAKGNIGPLARYLALGLAVGEGIGDVKATVRRRDRPTNLVERGLDNLSAVGGAGFIQDAFQAAQRGPEAMVSWIAGPTIGDVGKFAGGVGLALSGKPKTLARAALGAIPVVGQPISNTLMPPQGAYKSRTPDLIQEAIGLTPKVGAAEQAPSATSFLDKQKIQDQISSLNKDKKNILGQGQGIELPFIGRVGGITNQTKEQKVSDLERQKALLQAKKNNPNGDFATYLDSKGNWKVIDKSFQPEPPTLTGNTEIDKKSISDFNGQITQKANDIYDLYKAGQIDQNEANTQLSQLKDLKNQFLAPKKGKKIKIISPKKITFKSAKISLPRKTTIRTIKIKSAPKVRLSKVNISKSNSAPVRTKKLFGLTSGRKLV